MFAELMPLFPNTKGMIIMTVAKVDDLHLRVSFHPAADDPKDKPLISPLALEGTPAEFDTPGIDFAPLIEASKTINQQIAAKAEQVKTEPPPASANGNGKPVSPPAPVQRGKPGSKPKPAATPAPPPQAQVPAATPVTAAPAPAQAAALPQPTAPAFPAGDLRARLAALRNGGAA